MTRPQLAILTYHAVLAAPLPVPDWCFLDVSVFRSHMEKLVRARPPSRLASVVRELSSGELEEPAIAVTFDDGFRNNHSVAFPILRELRIPCTIFVNTGLLGTTEILWFCKINRAVAGAKVDSWSWNGETYDLSSTEMRAAASARVQRRLKEHPHAQLQREVRAICELLDDPFDMPVPAESPYAMLDRETIETMASSGLVEFGAHTHSHAILSLLTIEQQRSEILRSVEGVRRLSGQTGELFAYPNGRRQDYTAASIEILRGAGVRGAVTAVHAINDADAEPMELSRFSIGPDVSDAEFEEILDRVRA